MYYKKTVLERHKNEKVNIKEGIPYSSQIGIKMSRKEYKRKSNQGLINSLMMKVDQHNEELKIAAEIENEKRYK